MDRDVEFDLSKLRPPNINPRMVRWVFLGLLVIVFLVSSVFTIGPEELGVIQRFGKFVRSVPPGLNFKLPFGIEKVTKVPVERQLKQEFGFRADTPASRSGNSTRRFQQESLMLTGDLNASEVEWIVQFRVADPYKFLFKVDEERFLQIPPETVGQVGISWGLRRPNPQTLHPHFTVAHGSPSLLADRLTSPPISSYSRIRGIPVERNSVRNLKTRVET